MTGEYITYITVGVVVGTYKRKSRNWDQKEGDTKRWYVLNQPANN